jgi:hypothetical protein
MYPTLTAMALADDISDHCSKEGATTTLIHGCCIHQLTTTTTKQSTCASSDSGSGVCIVACYEIPTMNACGSGRQGCAEFYQNPATISDWSLRETLAIDPQPLSSV